jgi:hypothetical protein
LIRLASVLSEFAFSGYGGKPPAPKTFIPARRRDLIQLSILSAQG